MVPGGRGLASFRPIRSIGINLDNRVLSNNRLNLNEDSLRARLLSNSFKLRRDYHLL